MKKCSAIVVAGGSGTRFGADVPKQFVDLCGKSILQYSLELFEYIESVQEILLVLPEVFIGQYLEFIDQDKLSKLQPAIAGGMRRQDSVYNGLYAISEDSDIVLVHDAVRPLAPVDLIEQAIVCAREFRGAILASPAYDTLKKAGSEKIITDTLDRSDIWCAQTPQVFNAEILKKSFEKIIKDKIEITDEAQALEHCGHQVKIIEASKENLKITTQFDLQLAELILKARKSI